MAPRILNFGAGRRQVVTLAILTSQKKKSRDTLQTRCTNVEHVQPLNPKKRFSRLATCQDNHQVIAQTGNGEDEYLAP